MTTKELNKLFKIPGWVKGDSIAMEGQSIEKKFKDRTSAADLKTKEALLERLMQKQEYIKRQVDASMSANSTTVPDMMNGQVPPEMQNQAAFGNLFGGDGTALNQTNSSGVNMKTGQDEQQTAWTNSIKGGVQSAIPIAGLFGMAENAGKQLGQELGGEEGGDMAQGFFDPFSNVTRKDTNIGEKALSVMDPVVAGFITNKKNKELRRKQEEENLKKLSNQYQHNQYATGGFLNSPDPDPKKLNKKDIKSIKDSTGINFTEEGANQLFERNDSFVKPDYSKDLNLGPYKGLDYFNISKNGDEYILNPTKKNIRGPEAHMDSIKQLQKLNPELKFARQSYKPMGNRMAYGGMSNKYAYGTEPDPVPDVKSDIDANAMIKSPLEYKSWLYGGDKSVLANAEADLQKSKDALSKTGFYTPKIIDYNAMGEGPSSRATTNAELIAGKAGKWGKDNYGSIMRLAPIIGNLTDKIKKPVTDPGVRLNNVYKPEEFDTARAINRVNSIDTEGAAKASSAGNLGAYASNMRAGNIMKLKALSDEFQKADNVNRQENRFKHQADFRKDSTNAQLEERYIDRKARDLGAYETAKSAKRAALFEDIGKIGKEETYKKMAKEMFGYTWNGKYFVDKKGNKVDNKIVAAKLIEAEDTKEEQNGDS